MQRVTVTLPRKPDSSRVRPNNKDARKVPLTKEIKRIAVPSTKPQHPSPPHALRRSVR